ncbi:MAG: hypothetical protein UY16_C0013G0015 [Candidatus Gottesmanbacteria bacterium GW2011_GWA2_47_9]|uniref:Galactosyltransferase C-terminal domain-containing protein n=1 Tax=Candidatus Gottesmanbacteria bacterium GW2011_GWA2_47_9 TaxID=1618445 RepID=A0A0G1X115_9BACT|nr:MAG: hypothetical protein UY16_C0013G0015 [Candidatus Gottesmanbacteria bacterium GW2011_GWA2_47_9]
MFSIIIPLDSNRLDLFKNTKRAYDGMPQKKEFIIPSRSAPKLRTYFKKYKLGKNVRIIPYTIKAGFNCSKALNIGVRHAKYPSVIITSPEVTPITPVLAQLETVIGTNVVAQVFDEHADGKATWSLVNSGYRNHNPGYYFLAMFNKKDIEKINGWDEAFMHGYAYDDCDFGARWARAGIPFTIRDDIQGLHQYHPRMETVSGGWKRNERLFYENTRLGIIACKNGLVPLEAAASNGIIV